MTTGRIVDHLGINEKVKCGFEFKVNIFGIKVYVFTFLY
jgi:hypothetical protein